MLDCEAVVSLKPEVGSFGKIPRFVKPDQEVVQSTGDCCDRADCWTGCPGQSLLDALNSDEEMLDEKYWK